MVEELNCYVSDMTVLCGAEKLTVEEGKGKGTTLVRMYNGKWQLFLKADKCLDIFRADYKGDNICFITKNGLISNKLNNSVALGFAGGFDAGFLYTCGLDNIGTPQSVNGKDCIQHGTISYIPAENVDIEKGFKGGEYFVSVSGDMKYTALFGNKLILRREITLKYMSDDLIINDEIINESFSEDGYMLLYHFNLGYPQIDENATIKIDGIDKTLFVNDKAEKNYLNYTKLEKPKPENSEEVFCHVLKKGAVKAEVAGKYKLSIEFNSNQLPYLTQWKSMACGDYALGIEPATTILNNKETKKIQPFEKHSYDIRITVKG